MVRPTQAHGMSNIDEHSENKIMEWGLNKALRHHILVINGVVIPRASAITQTNAQMFFIFVFDVKVG